MRRSGIKAAIRSAREPCNLPIGILGDRIVAFLEHKDRNAQESQFARRLAQTVDRFFHGIANKNQSLHLLARMLLARVTQDLADLGLAATTVYARHELSQLFARRNPP